MSAPGWYPNPAADDWAWWDGTAWAAAPTDAPILPPGWYHAADEVHIWRWWDGLRFTGHTARYARPSSMPTEAAVGDAHVVTKEHGTHGNAGAHLLQRHRRRATPLPETPHLLGRQQHHRGRLVFALIALAFLLLMALGSISGGGTFFDPSILVFPGVAAVGGFFWAWHRRAIVVDTPTVDMSGAHPTRCEVQGEVRSLGAPVHGWVSGTPAVRTRTTARVTIGSGKNRKTYDACRIEAGSGLARVVDGTGSLRVDVAESDQRALWVKSHEQKLGAVAGYRGKWTVVEECIAEGTELWCSGPINVGLDGKLIMCRTDPSGRRRRAGGPFWTSYLGEQRLVFGQNLLAGGCALTAAICLGVATGVGAEWVPPVGADDDGIYEWYVREGVGGPVLGVLGTLAALLATGTLWRLWNRLVALREQAEMAWSNISASVQRRHDLVPRLAQVLGESMSYERATTEAVVGARNQRKTRNESDAVTQQLADDDTTRLLALAESHPELRTSAQAATLVDELVTTENQIAAHRRFYNDAITLLRIRSATWPGVIFSPLMGSWRRRELFSFRSAEEGSDAI